MHRKKAQVITIAEIKGGTGKTTTAAAIAQAAALDNKQILLIDLDPQANLTTICGGDPSKPGSLSLLSGYPVLELIQETYFDNISVIAGSLDLALEIPKKGTMYRLEKALEPILSDYDFIIIDTPPAFGEMTYNALQASNGLIIALDTSTSSLQGFYKITDLAKATKATNKKLKVLGCLITKYNPRPILSQRMKELIEDKAKETRCNYLGEVRQGIAIQESQAYGDNLFLYAPKSKPAQDYQEIYNKLFK